MRLLTWNRFRSTYSGPLLTTCLVGLLSGCTGEILGSGQAGPAGGLGAGSQGPGNGAGGSGPVAIEASWPVAMNGRASALRRLSRDELTTTLRSLTGQAPPRAELPEEQRSGHHPLRTSGMAFISSEVGKLLPVMKELATELAPTMLAQSGCILTGEEQRTCLAGWSKTFVERVLRRPTTPEEDQGVRAILAAADGTPEMDRIAMEGALTAAFFAPSFLYRTEIGVPASDGSGRRVLSGMELAAKLSFFASLGPPDAELSSAAKTGTLADGAERSRQLERLLQSPEGRRAQSVFVLEWLGANESKVSQKSASYLQGLSAAFAGDIRASADAFITSVLSGPEPTVGNLLTGKGYLVDEAVQQITRHSTDSGVTTGDQAGFDRIGLLMHPQVVASHTKENGASPFQVGYFLKEVLLCEQVAAPPANAAAMAKDEAPSGLSLRESLEFRTSAGPTCIGCHAQFAPLGFSFIALDPLGRWVEQDPSGKPWDLSGSVTTALGDPLEFEDPADMLREVAGRPQTQGCFAQAVLEWSLGRGLVAADSSAVAALDALIAQSGGNVPAIMKTIVSAPEFSNVVAPE